jgi:hypothetical protein
LARRLPMPVPVPVHLGAPVDRFPRPWIVTTWVEGEPGDRSPITNGPRSAAGLAAFMRALHERAPADAPVDRGRSVPLVELADCFARCLEVLLAGPTRPPRLTTAVKRSQSPERQSTTHP